VLSPTEALTIGVCGGALSVIGYSTVQPKLERFLGLHDTCGVHNLHGMPAIFAGLASAVVIAYSGDAASWSAGGVDGTAVPQNASSFHDVYGDLASRGRAQAGYQLLCVAVSFGMAIVGGLSCATLVKLLGSPEDEDGLFIDKRHWEVPTIEQPFYFDQRGEINRETIGAVIDLETSKHDGGLLGLAGGSRHGCSNQFEPANFGATAAAPVLTRPGVVPPAGISNELLNIKLDMLLQSTARPTPADGHDTADPRRSLGIKLPAASESGASSTESSAVQGASASEAFDKLRKLKEAFDVFDKDGDGRISVDELGVVVCSLGVDPTEDELKRMIAEVDLNRNGTVELDEFVALMAKVHGAT